MNLPIQSQPVMRNVSTAAFSGGIEASSLPCPSVCEVCRLLPFGAKYSCLSAAQSSGCDC